MHLHKLPPVVRFQSEQECRRYTEEPECPRHNPCYTGEPAEAPDCGFMQGVAELVNQFISILGI